MSFETLPDLPGAEHPERDWLQQEAEKTVADKVESLEIGLDLKRHPELRRRLAELGSHFEDSLAMARIIRTTYGKLKETLDLPDEGPERLMRAATLHDIGKSGPPGTEGEFHFAVRRLFVPPGRAFNPFIDGRAKTVAEFAAEQDLADRGRVFEALERSGIDPEKTPMVEFWRRHAEWTYGILKTHAGQGLDENTVRIAASHHLLEDQNPAGLDLAKAPAEAQILEVLEESELLAAVDKYQAFRSRGGLGHEEALDRLAKIIDERRDLPEPLRDKFRKVIAVLAGSKDALNQYFAKKTK